MEASCTKQHLMGCGGWRRNKLQDFKILGHQDFRTRFNVNTTI